MCIIRIGDRQLIAVFIDVVDGNSSGIVTSSPRNRKRREPIHFELGLDRLHRGLVCVDSHLAIGLVCHVGNDFNSIFGDMGNRHAVNINCRGIDLFQCLPAEGQLDSDCAVGLDHLAGGDTLESNVISQHAVEFLTLIGQLFGCILVFVRHIFQGSDHQDHVLVKGIRVDSYGHDDFLQGLGIDHLRHFGLFRLFRGIFRGFCLGVLRGFRLGVLRSFCLGVLRSFCLGVFRSFCLGVFRSFRLRVFRYLGLSYIFSFIHCGLCFLRSRLDSLLDCVMARLGLGRCLRFRGLRCRFPIFWQRGGLCLLFSGIHIVRYAGRCDFFQRLSDGLCDRLQSSLNFCSSLYCRSLLSFCSVGHRCLGIGTDDHAQSQDHT